MRYLSFVVFVYIFSALVYAGPQDKWVYIGPQIDGIALILAVGAFVWAYIIYRDLNWKKLSKRK